MTTAPSFDNFAFIEESESNSESSEPSDNEEHPEKSAKSLSTLKTPPKHQRPFIKNTLLTTGKSSMEKKIPKSAKNGKQSAPNRNKKSASNKKPSTKGTKKETPSASKKSNSPKKNSSTAPTSSKKVNKRVLQTNSYPNKKPKSIDNLSININSSSGVDKPIRTPLKKFPKKTVPFMSKEYQQLKDTCQELLTSIIFR